MCCYLINQQVRRLRHLMERKRCKNAIARAALPALYHSENAISCGKSATVANDRQHYTRYHASPAEKSLRNAFANFQVIFLRKYIVCYMCVAVVLMHFFEIFDIVHKPAAKRLCFFTDFSACTCCPGITLDPQVRSSCACYETEDGGMKVPFPRLTTNFLAH